jgi:hypothetical protein
LKVSVRDQKFNAFDTRFDHVIYGIAPATADTDDFNPSAG